MRKRIWILPVCMLVIIMGYLLHTLISQTQREHYIFCERLIPGMSKDEVLSTLQMFGEVEHGGNIVAVGRSHIFVGYIDARVVGQKTYILNFQDGDYANASVITGFEKGRWVCE